MVVDLPFSLDKIYNFYGIDDLCFKIDDQVIEVVEDPGDGYRSCLGAIELSHVRGKIFFGLPLDPVKIIRADDGEFDGYALLSMVDGHVWLRFGTDTGDDYYPSFVFDYEPREPS